MTIEELVNLPIETLEKVAKKFRIKLPGTYTVNQLAQLIHEAIEEEEEDRSSTNNVSVSIELKKYLITQIDDYSEDLNEDLELPDRYNETDIVLMLRDPSWAYIYWDISDRDFYEIFDDSKNVELFLRIFASHAPKDDPSSLIDLFEIPIQRKDSCRYINLPRLNCWYSVSLVGVGNCGQEQIIGKSKYIKTSRNYVVTGNIDDEEKEKSRNELIKLSGLSFSGASSFKEEDNSQRIISTKGAKLLKS